VIDEATAFAKSRNHSFVASEHIAYVLVGHPEINGYLSNFIADAENKIKE